jgi:hypothetical protein
MLVSGQFHTLGRFEGLKKKTPWLWSAIRKSWYFEGLTVLKYCDLFPCTLKDLMAHLFVGVNSKIYHTYWNINMTEDSTSFAYILNC